MTRPLLQRRELLALGALAMLAMATWLWSRQGVDDQGPVAQIRASAPGFYLHGAAILGTDEEGRALYRVQAASAEELPGENRLLLSDVAVVYQPEVDVPWVLTAARGEAFQDETYLDFTGEVQLALNRQADSGSIVIRTTWLRLEPESYDVHTDSPVSLFFDGQRLDAVGMNANLKDERWALESGVHGEFSP